MHVGIHVYMHMVTRHLPPRILLNRAYSTIIFIQDTKVLSQDIIWFRQWLDANFAPIHYLNQCWLIEWASIKKSSVKENMEASLIEIIDGFSMKKKSSSV